MSVPRLHPSLIFALPGDGTGYDLCDKCSPAKGKVEVKYIREIKSCLEFWFICRSDVRLSKLGDWLVALVRDTSYDCLPLTNMESLAYFVHS